MDWNLKAALQALSEDQTQIFKKKLAELHNEIIELDLTSGLLLEGQAYYSSIGKLHRHAYYAIIKHVQK